VVSALHHLGDVDTQVIASMPGGELQVRIDAQGRIWQRGPVEEVARITLSADLVARLQALP
jgi:diaminopimelate epimerase